MVLGPLTQFHITFVLIPRPTKCRRPVPKLSAPCMNIHGSPSRTNHGIVSSTFLQGERERGIPCECKVDREERRGEHKGRSREQYIQRQGQKQERKNKTRKTMNSKTDETAKEKKKRTERRVRVCTGVPSDDLGAATRFCT